MPQTAPTTRRKLLPPLTAEQRAFHEHVLATGVPALARMSATNPMRAFIAQNVASARHALGGELAA